MAEQGFESPRPSEPLALPRAARCALGRSRTPLARHRRARRWLAALIGLVAATGWLTLRSAGGSDPPLGDERPQVRPGVRVQLRLKEDPPPAQPAAARATTRPNSTVSRTWGSVRVVAPPSTTTAAPRAAARVAPAEGSRDETSDDTTESGAPRLLPLEALEGGAPTPIDSSAASSDASFGSEGPAEFADLVHPAEFQGITPGVTTRAELSKRLGTPLRETPGPQSALLVYSIGPFPNVEFHVSDERVESIRIALADPLPAQQVAAELELGTGDTALVVDEQGRVRGELYPERGIQLSWVPDSEPPDVTQILLEPPSALAFVKRAQQDPLRRYQRMLADLSVARRLDPNSSLAAGLEARLRLQLGQPTAALELITLAVRHDESSAEWQMLRAKILAALGRSAEGLRSLDELLATRTLAPIDRAEAECLRGDLLLNSSQGTSETALASYQAAIRSAANLTADPSIETQLRAQFALLDAFLGGATAIAQGAWADRGAAVDKWRRNARTLAARMFADDPYESLARWDFERRQLRMESYAGGRIPSDAIDVLRHDARRIAQRADDPLLESRLDWEFAEALVWAAELAQANGLWPEAREFAEEGLERANLAVAARESNASTDYLRGRLAFLIGSFHEIVSKDPVEALRWFDEAAQRFAKRDDSLPLPEQARHGLRLTFMGKTYAQHGRPEDARRWLARGAEYLESSTPASAASRGPTAPPTPTSSADPTRARIPDPDPDPGLKPWATGIRSLRDGEEEEEGGAKRKGWRPGALRIRPNPASSSPPSSSRSD